MAVNSVVYGTPVALTIALDGLAPSQFTAVRSSNVSNGTDGWESFEVALTIVGGAGANGTLQVYVDASGDNGVTFESGVAAAGSVSLNGFEQQVASVPVIDGVTTRRVFLLSSDARSGRRHAPRDFALLVTNTSGAALGVGCIMTVRGIRTQAI